MNILFYCAEYPPAKNGGIGTVTKIVAEGLVKRGHKVIVVGSYRKDHPYLGTGTQPECQIINGVKIISLFHFSVYSVFGGIWLRIIRRIFNKFWIEDYLTRRAICRVELLIKKLIVDENLDLIEFPDFYNLLLPLKSHIKLKKFNIPTILRVHGSYSFVQYYRDGEISKTTLLNDSNHFNRCDLVLSVSEFSKSFIDDKLSIKLPNKVIYNPIEDKLFKEYTPPSIQNRILFVGAVSEGKGIFSLIKAFNLVIDEISNIKLIVVGAGDIEKAKIFLKAKALDKVEFKGFLSKEEVLEEIHKAYICVLPSYFENFSMAALEVLASGRTLIYTNRCSGPEVITNFKNGILVDPDDEKEIANRIIYLFKNPDINNTIANQGYSDCKDRFSESIILGQLENEYMQLLSN